jgi:hypothetical protein
LLVVGEAFLLLVCGLPSSHRRRIIGEADNVVHHLGGEEVLVDQLILGDAQILIRYLWTLPLLAPLLIISWWFLLMLLGFLLLIWMFRGIFLGRW